MPSIFISGANRGIGLELAKQYAADGWEVHATARDIAGATELSEIEGDISLYEMDVKDISSIKAVANEVDAPLDVVIANAGVKGMRGDGGWQLFGELDYEAFAETFQVNTLGALATAESFHEHLKQGSQKRLAFITSLMGSIADTSSGFVSYRTSKAALNMAVQSCAEGLNNDGIAVTLFHPGWVKTDMGGEQAPVTPEESVSGMRRVLQDVPATGKAHYIDYTGKKLPW